MRIFSIIIFSLLMAACSGKLDVETAILAHTLPVSHPVHKGMEVFAQEAERLSSGKLKVKIYPDGQLGSEREVLELLQIGSVGMTKVSASAMANFAPEYKVLTVPYLFRDKEHLFRVLEGRIGQDILLAGSEYLLKGLCFYDAGSRSFYTKEKPVMEPDDLSGLKIRVMNDQMSVNMVNALGGSATPMSYGELYTALQQGVVDGAENNPPSFVTSRHYEICKYYSLDEHSSTPDVLVVGTKYWHSLSAEEHKWMTEAAELSVTAQKRFWKENVEECMEILADAGVEVVRPDKTVFAAGAASVLENFSRTPENRELVEKIKKQ